MTKCYSSLHEYNLIMTLKIAVLGTFNEGRSPRSSIVPALKHSAENLDLRIETNWYSENEINLEIIKKVDGVFIAPGSALEPSDNIIGSIKFVREKQIPCIGTCGGFQRILTEYASNVLGEENIYHAEAFPDAVNPLFSKLLCSIEGTEDKIQVKGESIAAEVYDDNEVIEKFYCNYGLNLNFINKFIEKGINFSGIDTSGDVRIFEIKNHPFMIGTLFVPQVISTKVSPHPLITRFIKEIKTYKDNKEN